MNEKSFLTSGRGLSKRNTTNKPDPDQPRPPPGPKFQSYLHPISPLSLHHPYYNPTITLPQQINTSTPIKWVNPKQSTNNLPYHTLFIYTNTTIYTIHSAITQRPIDPKNTKEPPKLEKKFLLTKPVYRPFYITREGGTRHQPPP